MRLERPIRLEVWDDIGDQLTSEPKMQFVVSIMVSNSDDLYGAMKKLCCAKSPIVSQVINIRIISQRALTKSEVTMCAVLVRWELSIEQLQDLFEDDIIARVSLQHKTTSHNSFFASAAPGSPLIQGAHKASYFQWVYFGSPASFPRTQKAMTSRQVCEGTLLDSLWENPWRDPSNAESFSTNVKIMSQKNNTDEVICSSRQTSMRKDGSTRVELLQCATIGAGRGCTAVWKSFELEKQVVGRDEHERESAMKPVKFVFYNTEDEKFHKETMDGRAVLMPENNILSFSGLKSRFKVGDVLCLTLLNAILLLKMSYGVECSDMAPCLKELEG
ncbi:hypothetical protein F2P81_009250 [Scophthalmus maximus]|uniref:Uncharacterized protein n=1 Tax=Scophthalmus maximus TaxID=52904 RepID=A0A6A4SU59_SCOMX|nr:hypothetical protein F2P81_009250 [Scophthalmus maximus]